MADGESCGGSGSITAGDGTDTAAADDTGVADDATPTDADAAAAAAGV